MKVSTRAIAKRTLFWISACVTTTMLVALHRSDPIVAAWIAVTLLTAWQLSAIDVREHRLPNKLVVPLAAVSIVVVVGLGLVREPSQAVTAGLVALGAFAVLVFLSITAGVGMGDAKCAVPFYLLLGWFGWGPVRISVLATFIAAGVVGAAVARRHSDLRVAIPFGPFMTTGLIFGLASAA